MMMIIIIIIIIIIVVFRLAGWPDSQCVFFRRHR